jgi:hypothetical protein
MTPTTSNSNIVAICSRMHLQIVSAAGQIEIRMCHDDAVINIHGGNTRMTNSVINILDGYQIL